MNSVPVTHASDCTPDSGFVLPDTPAELQASLAAGNAVAWYESVEILTYEPSDPSEYPMYLDQRVYQGSSGRVYPLPFTERIQSVPTVRRWNAIHVENQYIRVMILPELGGRIHVGYDKTTGYDFFYRNNVIKPALVGLAGAWMSGGVEFNWPQHHRPTTFLPVESTIEQHDDGSVTVWCSDHDPFARMKGAHGVHLSPRSSVIRLDVRLHNRTSLPQTFLWWANVAVRVHDDYQSFFPEDVQFVADHARRALTAFPRADRPYYGVDYRARAEAEPGADRIDFYRNIPVPTSYMIVDTEHEFFGGFDHAAGAGFVHWADRRVAPGKKQWTWGDAPFGHAWDRLLTDDDGPYVELMAGVYTDNQPDFSWLAPGECKRFTQYWYPIPDIGVAHGASPDAAIHVDRHEHLSVAVAVTAPQPGSRLVVRDARREVLAERAADLLPGSPLVADLGIPFSEGLTIELQGRAGDTLVEWSAPSEPDAVEPWTATAPPAPQEVDSVDELFFIGQHLVQYRHPSRSPLPYWREALRRDPSDSRVLAGLAELAYRAADYGTAKDYAQRAVARISRRNANPRNADALYLLGLIETRLGDHRRAREAFAKSSWDAAFAGPAGLEMACRDAAEGRAAAALHDLDELDAVASRDHRRSTVRVLLLRRLGRAAEAEEALARLVSEDPLNPTAVFLDSGRLPADGRTNVDVALELARAGEDDAALEVLAVAAAAPPTGAGNATIMAHYHRAAILDRLGRADEAAAARASAQGSDRRWSFPAGLDDHDALDAAVRTHADPVARLLLGMLLFDTGRRREALSLWEEAIRSGLEDPLLFRNAGLASYRVAHDDERALHHYRHAVALAPTDSRLLFEYDQLLKKLGESDEQRLRRLTDVFEVVSERDDLLVEYADLLVSNGRASDALALLETRRFQPWEGGEGRVLGAWDRARAALGLPLGDPPSTLGEGRPLYEPPIARRPDGDIDYFATSLPDLLLFYRGDDD